MLDAVNDLILDLAGQSWMYAAVAALAALDAFLPPMPSESVIVALAALGDSGVNLWLLGVIGALGALIGDSIAYTIGRRVGTERFAWQRSPRISKAFVRAGKELDRRGGVLIFTARYIPVGRIAVMTAAGATGMSWRRFLTYASIACSAWAMWCVAVGAVAGELFQDNPLLAAAVGIVIALGVGGLIDRVVSRRHPTEEHTPEVAAPSPR